MQPGINFFWKFAGTAFAPNNPLKNRSFFYLKYSLNWELFSGILLLVLLVGQGWAQSLRWGEQEFLNKEEYPWWGQRYENYSLLSYRDYEYGTTRDEKPTFDPFGNYILDGETLLSIEERRTHVPRVQGSSISWSDAGRFRNLVIMRDQYKRWSTRLMISGYLDVHFTPLTLAKASLPGLRWDGSSHKNSFTVVGSRVSTGLGGGTQRFSTYLYGAYWESQLGDIASLGVSYVNLLQSDSMQRKGSLSGDFPIAYLPSRSFYLMVSDDSPGDGVGVQVFDVKLRVNGRETAIHPETKKIANILEVVGASLEHVPHLRRDRAWAVNSMTSDRLLNPRYGLFGDAEPMLQESGQPLEVAGTDLLVYRFDLPTDLEAENLDFQALVSGDYSLDVGTTADWEGVGNRVWSDWHNVARAPGNIADGSNLKWVSVPYGAPVGLMQFGINFSTNLFGVNLAAEYVDNYANFIFPYYQGDRQRVRQSAYFAKFIKDMGGWDLGGEYFDIPEKFQTSLPMWSESSGAVVPYDLVDDNDDRDEWADIEEHWDPLDPEYINLRDSPGVDVETKGPSAGYGVFPGLDKEKDGLVDINVNRNAFPDYTEPFLMYLVEPDDFVYGDDMNNNGVVDERENDNTPNYPYDLDSRGFHLFVALQPASRLGLRLGRYQIDQPAGGGKNEVSYAKLEYLSGEGEGKKLDFHYRLKRVRDDIPDPVYIPIVNPLSETYKATRILPDPMLMRNSLVQTLFLQNHHVGPGRLQLKNSTKFEVNSRQNKQTSAGNHIVDWTWVSKADYPYPIGQLTVTPMVKLLLQRRNAPRDLIADRNTWEFFPILRADYPLSEQTILRMGLQGLPVIKHFFRNQLAPTQDFDARHYIFNIQTHSNYMGYDVSVNFGFRSSLTRSNSLPGEPEQKFREFFLQARIL